MNAALDSKPSLWLRILHFAPTRMALFYLTLTYLYLAAFFYRTSFTHGPLQALAATVMAGATMLIVYASLVVYIERRTVSELALPPLAREIGLGLLLGFGLYTVCVLILTGLGNYRIVGLHEWHILLTGMATALATGVFEELLFRGGLFRLSQEWFGT